MPPVSPHLCRSSGGLGLDVADGLRAGTNGAGVPRGRRPSTSSPLSGCRTIGVSTCRQSACPPKGGSVSGSRLTRCGSTSGDCPAGSEATDRSGGTAARGAGRWPALTSPTSAGSCSAGIRASSSAVSTTRVKGATRPARTPRASCAPAPAVPSTTAVANGEAGGGLWASSAVGARGGRGTGWPLPLMADHLGTRSRSESAQGAGPSSVPRSCRRLVHRLRDAWTGPSVAPGHQTATTCTSDGARIVR
ncbi:hypothetical protein EV562_11158 [Streptomyces sp. BK208]|nr:hypothetical protein EV562_11158 [Streptomyces sp. BK208]